MEQVENLPELDTEVQNLKLIIGTISSEVAKQFPGDQASYIQTILRKDFMKEIRLRNQWIDTAMSISQTLIENYESLRILYNDLVLQNESKDIKIKENYEEIQRLRSIEESKTSALEVSRDSIGSGRRSLSNQRPVEGLLFSQLNKAGRMQDINRHKKDFILKAEKLSFNKKYEELQQKYLDQLNENQKMQRNIAKLEELIKYNAVQKQIAESRYETLLSNHHQVKSQLEQYEKKGKDLKKRKSMMPKLVSKQVSWKSEAESFDSKDTSLLDMSADAIKPEALKLGLSLDNSLSIIDSEIRGNSENASNDSRITTEESDIIENDLVKSKSFANKAITDAKNIIRHDIYSQENIQCIPIHKNYNREIQILNQILILGESGINKIRNEEESNKIYRNAKILSQIYREEVANICKSQLKKETDAKLSLSKAEVISISAFQEIKNKSEKIIEKPVEVAKVYATQKNKQKEYFDMTLRAVEQNLNYSESVYSNTSQILYEKLIKFNVPFCKWHKWVEKEIKAFKKRNSAGSGQFQLKVCSLFPFMGKDH
ncbi:unnamed protein product [Blepharisma stoltei]|uniref:Uncharacterized protein n=1 Tax=Blepharisma stoltei TaxID=1481888 RepID=A0AAU9K9G8_9CILI|nr:unnamed protein product [Blepharisma stoltei]